jgi:putative phage-type endonuclease
MEKQEWLKSRKIGSSDAIVIMGCAPREWEINTPYKLWQQRINETETTETFAMQKGKAYEEHVIAWAEDHLGHLLERQKLVFHKENGFMSATLDAISYDGKIIVEAKVSGSTYLQISAGKIPAVYYPQVQHQLEVSGADKAYLVGMVVSNDDDEHLYASIEVPRDDKYIAEMMKKEKVFWECLTTYTPPDLTNWDYVEREDGLWDAAAYELLMLDKELEAYEDLKKKRDTIRDRLIELANGRNTRGGGVKLTQSFPKGRINYETIPELKLVDLEQYREPSKERWTLSKYGS